MAVDGYGRLYGRLMAATGNYRRLRAALREAMGGEGLLDASCHEFVHVSLQHHSHDDDGWILGADYVHPTSDSDEDESSVLDRNKVDMRIMELGGKTFYSEDVRKADEQAKQAR